MRITPFIILILSLSSCKREGSRTYFIQNDSRYTLFLYSGEEHIFRDSIVRSDVKNLRVVSGLSDRELVMQQYDTAAVAADISGVTTANGTVIKKDIYLNSNWKMSIIDDRTYQYTLIVKDEDVY